MAILVTGLGSAQAASTDGVTTRVVTINANVAVGDVVVVVAASNSSVSPSTCSDTASNSWTLVHSCSGGALRMRTYRSQISAAMTSGVTQITIDWGLGNEAVLKLMAVLHIRNVDSSSAYDGASTSAGGNSGVINATIGDRTRAENVVIAARAIDQPDTYGTDSEFTSVYGLNQQNRFLRVGYENFAVAAGTVSLDETNQVAGVPTAKNWTAGLIAFKGPAPPSVGGAMNLMMGVG